MNSLDTLPYTSPVSTNRPIIYPLGFLRVLPGETQGDKNLQDKRPGGS